jgi:hypothetical protein
MDMRSIAIGSGFVVVAALAAAVLIGPRPGVSATTGDLPRVISVSGEGEVKTRPDMATITTGVVTEGATAKDALAKNNGAMAAVINTLKNAGVSEDDIQTSDFSVSPKYPPYQPNQTTAPRIVGYTVSNTVTARVKNLDKLGGILDALVQAGSNQISGISFGLNETKATMNEARKKAVADARAKAELYAGAAGVSVGKVVQISETSAVIPVPVMYKREAMAQSADASVPIAVGQSTVVANVTVVFEIQ